MHPNMELSFVYKAHILQLPWKSSLESLILLRITYLEKICVESPSVIHIDTLLNPS